MVGRASTGRVPFLDVLDAGCVEWVGEGDVVVECVCACRWNVFCQLLGSMVCVREDWRFGNTDQDAAGEDLALVHVEYLSHGCCG